jgi:hypothetical protein
MSPPAETARSQCGGRRAGDVASLCAIDLAACLLLLAQYLLGMVVNLYVTIPAHHPGAGAGDYFGGVASGLAWVLPSGPVWLAAHAALGLALVLAAVANAVLSLRSGRRGHVLTSWLGALTIVGAGFNGASFLSYGHAFSSMIMAGLWAVALGSYLTGLYLTARSRVCGVARDFAG